ncbi:MAG: radical SAM protein [Crocosphaera sp.]|uniref:Radical SAM core domain-containing protein n=3 Tax=Crocosphaera watsonii TaxID=263511 RepID=T2JQN3_CROWT|nr:MULTISPECIES: radical SAM protein [Crocosphaera]EHJ11367.1 hypothetical protein CWATWH0003_3902 [Crocosphaera watsonii WH 0003]MCH2247852.1 radical SAM protein [Crocosphaera sp.]CCQ54032.1 hypothetical protein CWATWH0005_190 [Crocosphaera watsonii WH 0005]CCQ66862.1 hypothetical protein CWATWH0402_277 [Crocosphaera watsonii WH 0402]
MPTRKPLKRGLSPYYGEFLISPIPLELSGNHCSHLCDYCFANLGSPGAIFDEKATYRLIEKREKRKILQAKLLSKKYPVLISNRSDPFSMSNYKQFVPLMRRLTELEIPISIQTRGGLGIDETLKFLPPSVWYISITHDNEETRKKVEKHASSIDDRFHLILKLKEQGHRVVVGVNPLVPEWIVNPGFFLNQLKVSGVEGIWIERLHLAAHQQRKNLSKRAIKALGEDVFDRAKKKSITDKERDVFDLFIGLCETLEIPYYSVGQPYRSDFFKPYREIYPKSWPTTQEFLNHLIDNDIQEFGFNSWFDFMLPYFPEDESRQHSLYLYTSIGYNRRECHEVIAEMGRPRNYEELLSAIWSGQKFRPKSRLFLGCAAFEELEKGRVRRVDYE